MKRFSGQRWVSNGAKIVAALLVLSGPALADGDIFGADSRLSVTTVIVSSTVAPIIISGPAMLYGLEASSSILTPVFVKLYNSVSVTCGSGVPTARYQIPPSTASPLQQSIPNGDAYGQGLTACITGGLADSDTTPPAANSYLLNLHFKRQQ
jgi:hypothetical protein